MCKESYEASHGGSVKYEVSLQNILGFLEYIEHRESKTYTTALLTITDANKKDIEAFIDFWTPLVDEVMVWKPHNFAGGRSYRKIDHSKQESCGRPFNGPLIVAADGRVSICCLDFNSQLIIGDMKKDTLHDVLHSEAYRRIKRAHSANEFKGLICFKCCQTNFDPTVLVYASNKDRAVGKENSSLIDLREGY